MSVETFPFEQDHTIWTTADGRDIVIEQMNFHHARNVVHHIDSEIEYERRRIRANSSEMVLCDYSLDRIAHLKRYRVNVVARVKADKIPLGALRSKVKNTIFHLTHPRWKIGDPR